MARVTDRMAALMAWQHAGGGCSLLAEFEREAGPVETWWERRALVLSEHGSARSKLRGRLLSPDLDHRVTAALAALPGLGFEPVAAETIEGLAELPEPPLVLYVRGRLPAPEVPALAVVGARRATAYGRRQARRLAREVARRGVPVISGLARGIDGEAHDGALEADGVTVAVLGSGPDRIYPPEHAALLERISEKGAVVTEHLPGVPPKPHHFPRRNRIMVAFSRALLLVEAKIRSGSLTSVRWAADMGRDVLVVPGPVDSEMAEAPLELLREGATAVGSAAHILEALGLEAGEQQAAVSRQRAGLSAAHDRLLALLSSEPIDLDALVRLSGDAPGRVMALLLSLELAGLVTRDAAMRYARSDGITKEVRDPEARPSADAAEQSPPQ